MKFFSVINKKQKKAKRNSVDRYQATLDEFGREQFKKLIEKGIQIQLVSL